MLLLWRAHSFTDLRPIPSVVYVLQTNHIEFQGPRSGGQLIQGATHTCPSLYDRAGYAGGATIVPKHSEWEGRSMLREETLGFSRLKAAEPITFYDFNRLDEKETIWIPFEGKYSEH
jgi:hypothetical protein